jgi:hypothetical protein
LGREVRYPQALFPALALAARVLMAAGRRDSARAHADELLGVWRASTAATASYWTADLAFALSALGDGSELIDTAAGVAHTTAWLDAATAFAAGDAHAAADRYAAIGSLPDQAYAALRSGADDASAAAFVRRVGAAGYA